MINELAKNARKEKEYFEFINERLNLVKLLQNTDLKRLDIEELKSLNKKMYAPCLDGSALLQNNNDGLHCAMSYIAYKSSTLFREIFTEKFNMLNSDIDFVTKSTIIIDKCLNNEEKLEALLNYIKNYHIENLKLFCEDYVKSLHSNPVLSKIIEEEDLENPKYLYLTGSYISENELKLHKYFLNLPEKKIDEMSLTVVEGFLRGYKSQNLDITKKKYVAVKYPLGCERMARRIGELLKEKKLDIIYGISSSRVVNRQLGFFHKNDDELYTNKDYAKEYVLQMENAFKSQYDILQYFGGSLWVDTFGELPFDPKPEVLYEQTEEVRTLSNKLYSEFVQIYDKYTNSDERSFTIISYPCPDIGEKFEEIFDETIKINTLDCNKYEKIQQYLIDTLDKGDYVHIIGKDKNKTDLKVKLQTLSNPEKETLFENCTADVNIPVGEVFTTPELKGTSGKLYVSQVYLSGLKYTDLEIDIENGCTTNYNCSVFEKEAANKDFIRENILYNYETLPMGEFAIGTNTLAYVIARKYQIEDKLDILIAEKTGPHFAFGDSCFSRQEEIITYNPNGKEMVAKENDYSKLRDEDMSKAYFGCHTDITIPFNEIGVIKVINYDGTETKIIENGLFVLPGTEELNLEEMKA